jgi:putative transposase
MPRPIRLQAPGALYHVTARGNRQQQIFNGRDDYLCFLALLAGVVERLGWRCHAYCLMPNHFHLVIETPEPNLSIGMQRLNGRYAQWFNQTYGYSGHLFQGRFYSGLVESNHHLLELVRYVLLNPVRAGLCSDASGWEWSSFLSFVGRAATPTFLTVDWILKQFGIQPQRARAALQRFILDAPWRPPP